MRWWLPDAPRVDPVVSSTTGRVTVTRITMAKTTSMSPSPRSLRAVTGAGDRTVLIGEREGAQTIAAALRSHPGLADDVVLVNGGAIDPQTAAALIGRRVMVAFDPEDPSATNARRTVAALRQADVDVTVVEDPDLAWINPFVALQPRLQTFLQR